MYIFRKGIMPAMPGRVQNLSRIWEDLLPLAIRRTCHKRGTYFSFSSDSEAYTFGYIKSGHTGTIQPLPDGQEQIKMLISEGCLFHEAYIFAGFCNNLPLHRCLSDVEIYQFPGAMLVDPKFATKHPAQYVNALWQMSMKTTANDMLLDIAGLKTVAMKVAYFLYCCSNAEQSLRFTPNITQLDLGQLLNIHKSSLNRTFLAMESMSIIDGFTKKHCAILDKSRLKAVADGVLTFCS